MLFNLAKNSAIVYNLTIGNVELNYTQTNLLLLEENNIEVTTLSSGSIFCIDCDLNSRFHIDSVRYYFNSTFDKDTVASGIVISYKNNSFDQYIPIDVAYTTEYYYTVNTPTLFCPRYIRFIHTLDVCSGTLYRFEILNNTTMVDFGNTGALEVDSMSAARGESRIKEVSIYNRTQTKTNANVQIESTYEYIDDYISIGTSPQGPWKSTFNPTYVITKEYEWTDGTLGNALEEINGLLSLRGEMTTGRWASNIQEATYRTKVFSFPNLCYSNLYLDYFGRDSGCFFSEDLTDVVETMSIKSLSSPSDYYVFRKPYTTDNDNYYCADYSVSNSVLERVFSGIAVNYTYNDGSPDDYLVTINNAGVTAMLLAGQGKIAIVICGADFSVKRTRHILDGLTANAYYLYNIIADLDGGVWVYLYSLSGVEFQDINQRGYYLFHYTSLLDNTCAIRFDDREIFNISSIPTSTSVWYTNVSSKTVVLLSSSGGELITVSNDTTTALRGCCALSDGGCWYINDDNLYRLDSDGNLIDSILGICGSKQLTVVKEHTDGSLFLREGDYVYRILTTSINKGFVVFKVNVPYAHTLIPETHGVWVYCTTGLLKFIGETDGAVTYTIGALVPAGVYAIPGIFRANVIDENWKFLFPTNTDPVWGSASFKKVDVNFYALLSSLYHQIELTLRANKPYDKFTVPYSVSSWIADDAFDNESGYTVPYAHRWTSHENILIDTNSGTCVFMGDNDVVLNTVVYLSSIDKWYIKGYYSTDDYDIQIDYNIPDYNLEDVTFRIEAISTVVPTDYIRVELIRIGLTSMTLQVISHYYTEHSTADYFYGTLMTIDPIENSGKLRIKKDNAAVVAWLYKNSTSTWEVSSSISLGSAHKFNNDPNFIIQVSSISNSDIITDNFKVNSGDIYWYIDSPKLRKIYLRDFVTLTDVFPNNYKNVYIKTELPANNNNYIPNVVYNCNLKVWWEMQL